MFRIKRKEVPFDGTNMKENESLSDLPSAPPPSGSKPSYRILIVDDEKAVRNLHLELLTGAGYEAMAVTDGAFAWDAIQTQHFDLMITDNSMPKVTGVELINKLVASNIRLPFIMVTGALAQHELSRSSWVNDSAVLVKPVSNSALLSMVEKVLNKAKDIPNDNIDPKELAATMMESPPPGVVSKEEGIDKAEARSEEAAALYP
jgi:CheY-like chemotaxis protein